MPFVFLVIAIVFFYRKEFSVKDDFASKPFKIKLQSNFEYADICSILEKNCKNNECFKFSDHSAFFRLKKRYTVRVILYETPDFNKKEFDEEKKKINRKANKLYNIRHWVSMNKARFMMRVNLIYSNGVNQTLSDYISSDAELLLTRNEGIINFVICGDELIVPPLQPTISLYVINRYKDMIHLVLWLLNKA